MLHFLSATFNRHELTYKSVSDIVKEMSIINKDYRIIIIEAGDANKLRLKFKDSQYSKVEIIQVSNDTFWTSAMSIGIDNLLANSIDGDIFALFNNDIRIPPGTIHSLMKYNFQKKIAVSPISISSNDGKSVSTGVKVLSWPFCIHKAKYINLSINEASSKESIEVDFMTQRFFWCGRHVIKNIGNYRADILSHYGGDYELTSRMVNNGFKVILDPKIYIYIDEADTGLNSRYRKLNFFQRVQSLYSIKSSSNLWVAIKFSFSVAPWWSQPLNMFIMAAKAFIRAILIKPRT
jgi:GT2 family glycosyltransferase